MFGLRALRARHANIRVIFVTATDFREFFIASLRPPQPYVNPAFHAGFFWKSANFSLYLTNLQSCVKLPPMKKACSVLLVVLFALPLLRCTQDETDPVPETDGTAGSRFSLTEARGHYMQSMRTRSAQSGPDTASILPVGHFDPVWDAAAFSENEYLASYDVPVQGQYRYTLLARTDDGGTYPIELLYRLVSIKTPDQGHICEYLLFFVPDLDYDIRNRGERIWEGILNSGETEGFCGLLLYTTLEGIPVCAARYRDGVRTTASFIGDTTRTFVENAERLYAITGPLTVHIADEPKPNPKDTTQWDSDGGMIDDVVCVTRRVNYWDTFQWSQTTGGGRNENPRPPVDPPGGGSGGGDSNSDKGSDKPGDNILRDNPQVDSLVEKLLEDCMGQVLLDLIDSDITVITDGPGGGNHYDDKTRTVYFDAWDKDHAMIVLIEELTHAYQFQEEGAAGYSSHGLNNEIEAKMGWYIYTIRNNINLDLRKYLGGWQGALIFKDLKEYYTSNSINNISFDAVYDLIVKVFRTNPTYSDTNKYKESRNHRTFDNLDKLMADCIGKN